MFIGAGTSSVVRKNELALHATETFFSPRVCDGNRMVGTFEK